MKRRNASISQNYKGFFEDWEIAIAVRVVNEARIPDSLVSQEPFEDLLQEVLTHWYFVRDKYDPSRGASKQTFMSKVIRNKLRDLEDTAEADIRKAAYVAESLDRPLDEEDAESDTAYDITDPSMIVGATRDPTLDVPRSKDVSEAIKALRPMERRLCQLLMDGGYTGAEMAELLGIDRSTFYEKRKRIRALFEKRGLKDYLK
jgi:RNA polymerase sigma factor (sigma-70 family)